MASNEPTPGITFRETMGGWFALGQADPKQGEEKGKQDHTLLSIRPMVTIEDLDRFQFEERHTGRLESTIHFPPLFGPLEPTGTGVFNLFAPVGNTKLKLMIYEFGFAHEGQDYYFYGQKGVANDPGFDMWKDTTTLFSKLYKGNNRVGLVIGTGVLRITLPGFLRQLATMRVTNTRSRSEKLGAYLTFANFFAGQLWDTYVKRS